MVNLVVCFPSRSKCTKEIEVTTDAVYMRFSPVTAHVKEELLDVVLIRVQR
jgi:hypothetical protein